MRVPTQGTLGTDHLRPDSQQRADLGGNADVDRLRCFRAGKDEAFHGRPPADFVDHIKCISAAIVPRLAVKWNCGRSDTYTLMWLRPRGSAPSVTGLAFGGTCAKRGRPI